ncbi:hypothetical protein BG011_006627 [Mortierella polycephala]|uniref:RING-type domain-containing protein n=1 Tax=Mortierella polycephala TaxID=41804 RepID=A0A9P6PVJ8_9FUNG|nr:hypothetical protein BG011_006627 [Mortierella polycephala]
MSEPLPSLAQPHAHAPMAAAVTMTTEGPVNNEVEANGAQTDNSITNVSRPRSVVDFAIDSANTNPGATIAVLIVDKDASCLFLKVLLILYTVRSLFGLPFTIYGRLHPRVQGAPPTSRDILLDRQRTMMEITGTCLFFMSNYFLFTQADCRQEAPAVFYMTVVHIILGYIVILIPIILCLAVILCLPLVLRVMRALDLRPNLGVKGATEEMIAAIPIVKYRKPVESEAQISQNTVIEIGGAETGAGTGSRTEADSVQGASDIGAGDPQTTAGVPSPSTTTAVSSATAPSTPRRSKGGIFGFFRRSKKGDLNGSGKAVGVSSPDANVVEYLTLNDPQDAICAICLCDYEDEEELRKMKCLHYFHKDCVDEWLRLHCNCPLCKRDIEELPGPRSPTMRGSTPVADTSRSPSTASSPRRIQSEPVLVTIPHPQR